MLSKKIALLTALLLPLVASSLQAAADGGSLDALRKRFQDTVSIFKQHSVMSPKSLHAALDPVDQRYVQVDKTRRIPAVRNQIKALEQVQQEFNTINTEAAKLYSASLQAGRYRESEPIELLAKQAKSKTEAAQYAIDILQQKIERLQGDR